MLPSSHRIPMNTCADTIATPTQLTGAFDAFIAAANRLEHSHWELHNEVTQLRKELEERNRALASSLAENERMRIALRQILDTLPCGVVVLEATREEIVLLNPEARRLLAISADGTPPWNALPARVRTAVNRAAQRMSKPNDEHEFCVEEAGDKRWLMIRHCTMQDAACDVDSEISVQRMILIIRDTTAQRQAEQHREASRNLVALAEMATVLAHEIRNPLGSLELLAGLLAKDAGLSSDSKEYVQHLQAGVRSLSTTVNNVLRFHTLGSPHRTPVNVAATLKSAVEFVRPLAEQNGVTLKLREALGETEILGEQNGLQQVILNLACNALRHTAPGGAITVSASIKPLNSGKTAVIEFSDTGSGISPEHLNRIFEPGFSTTRQSPGLGLTVCRRIVEQHRGTIQVQSELKQGTTFRMEFPVL